MDKFLFEVKSRKILIIIHFVVALIVALLISVYVVSVWNELTTGVKIFLCLIGLLGYWYAYDRIGVFNTKIAFHEKGMIIYKRNKSTTLALNDIQNYRFIEKRDEVIFEFTKTDGSIVSLSSDDYGNLTASLDKYGKMVNFEIRTSFK